MNLEEKLDKLIIEIQQIKISITEIQTALSYKDTGLIPAFERLEKDYHNFKKSALIIFGILIGSGVLAVGLAGLLK